MTPSFTRRSVLRAGILTSVGAIGLSGVASGKSNGRGRGGGGRGFITTTATELLDGPFVVTGEVPNANWNPTPIAPSCTGRSAPQDHVPYFTDRRSDGGPWIFFPADRNVNLDVAYEIVNYQEDCGVVIEPDGNPGSRNWIKVVAKPA